MLAPTERRATGSIRLYVRDDLEGEDGVLAFFAEGRTQAAVSVSDPPGGS